ncbi:MAG: NAD-dependent epimerase/dehydratase family protein [Candidatus Micrarchaeota archaeon]
MLLVTGATGKVGRALIEALLKGKKWRNKIRVLVRKREEAGRAFGKNVQIAEADLSSGHDFIAIAEACKGVDEIAHLAALIDYGAPDEKLMRLNYRGTEMLIRAAKLQKKPPKFIFLSSTSIYRGVKEEIVGEKTKPCPLNAYGRSKLLAENALKESGIPYIILRSPIVYGKGFTEGFSRVIKMIKRGRMVIIGKGDNPIPHINIGDLVKALELCINSKVENEDFIVASSERLTQEQMYAILAKALHVPAPKLHVPKAVAARAIEGISAIYRLLGKKPKIFKEYVHTLADRRVFNTAKAQKMLHFRSSIPLREGVLELL